MRPLLPMALLFALALTAAPPVSLAQGSEEMPSMPGMYIMRSHKHTKELPPRVKMDVEQRRKLESVLEGNLNATADEVSLPRAGREELEDIQSVVQAFYLRIWTLDDSFPDLFALEIYNRKLSEFEFFKAQQRSRGAYESFRKGYVNVSGLQAYLMDFNATRAQVKVSGPLFVVVAGLSAEHQEDALFTLIRENGEWRILKVSERDMLPLSPATAPSSAE